LAGARLISSASSRLVKTGPNEVVNSPGLLVVDPRSDQIRGDKVGRELNAPEGATNGSRQRLDGERLGQARHALDQQVPLRQDRDQHALQEMILADDDLLDLVENALHFARTSPLAPTALSFMDTCSIG
jgi:hypothetical protein